MSDLPPDTPWNRTKPTHGPSALGSAPSPTPAETPTRSPRIVALDGFAARRDHLRQRRARHPLRLGTGNARRSLGVVATLRPPALLPALLGSVRRQLRFDPCLGKTPGCKPAGGTRAPSDNALALGVVHQLLHPGEALVPYALFGLLVLLPSTWLPRWMVAAGAAVAIPPSLWLLGGGLTLVPGSFLLGSALVRYGLVERIEHSARVLALLLAASSLVAAAALGQQLENLESSGFDTPSGVAGAAMASAYAAGILLMLRGPLAGRVLITVFAPLGRMALTNYVSATLVMVAARYPLDLQGSTSWATVLGLATAIIVVQVFVSTWWLAHHRHGPLEWVWRWATWGRRPDPRPRVEPRCPAATGPPPRALLPTGYGQASRWRAASVHAAHLG